ncbi:MAG TPA: TetR family transcriptional regulator [Bacteroidales bacterium]|jgi:AcrR family transcriptional regulator|nr:TetR family transcriptional regulator [Bacteroidales bacterium]
MANKLKVKELIIEVARDVFSRYGYKKTTMDDIAIGARKGKSSIYYYFKSKEEIYEAVVDTESNILFKEIYNQIEQPVAANEKFKLYVFTRMNKIRELSNFYEVMKNESLYQLDFIMELRNKYNAHEIAILQNILNEGVKTREFSIQDPELAAIALVTAIKGLEAPLLIKGEKRNLEKRIDYVVRILFYGIMRR